MRIGPCRAPGANRDAQATDGAPTSDARSFDASSSADDAGAAPDAPTGELDGAAIDARSEDAATDATTPDADAAPVDATILSDSGATDAPPDAMGVSLDATLDSGVGDATSDALVDAAPDGPVTTVNSLGDDRSTVTCTWTRVIDRVGCSACASSPGPDLSYEYTEVPVTVVPETSYPTFSCTAPLSGYSVALGATIPSNLAHSADTLDVQGPWCLETVTATELVATPSIAARASYSGNITVTAGDGGTQAVVAFTGTEYAPAVFGCGGLTFDCWKDTVACHGAATLGPCDVMNGGCDPNATCTVTGPSTTSCTCIAGYQGDGGTCTPGPNPCDTNNGGCDPNATCVWPGAGAPPSCTCNTGYAGDGGVCTVIHI